jgi:hypothetical protein
MQQYRRVLSTIDEYPILKNHNDAGPQHAVAPAKPRNLRQINHVQDGEYI